jgi:hypothetical protein
MFAHVRQCSLTARTAVDLREYTLSGYQRTHLSKLGVKWSQVQILSAQQIEFAVQGQFPGVREPFFQEGAGVRIPLAQRTDLDIPISKLTLWVSRKP